MSPPYNEYYLLKINNTNSYLYIDRPIINPITEALGPNYKLMVRTFDDTTISELEEPEYRFYIHSVNDILRD